jgi:PIN domain nuclease of toxin-antitoxin system
MNGPYVLDASAVLAFLREEEGSDVVESSLVGSFVSWINASEVQQKALGAGAAVEGLAVEVIR